MPVVSSSTSTPQRTDEDLINRSLLDSIDADHQAEHSSTSHRPLSNLDPVSIPYSYIPRHPSPTSSNAMSMHPDLFSPQDDIKRAFGRPSYTPFGPLLNGTINGQPPVLGGPYREPAGQKYQVPTAADIYGVPDIQRGYDYRDTPREYVTYQMGKHLGGQHGLYHPGSIMAHSSNAHGFIHNHHREEEISTIFVVGFPEDMQEREFQNMFTFAKGFEAASLKIPHKEHPTHNGLNNTHQTGYPMSSSYNTLEFVAPGLDQSNSVWSTQPPEEHFNPPLSHGSTQRKQIIGFAKFRTRAEALEARDFLQGRKVDVEKGAMLKAEMAKKNLHTKRGPGPSGLPLSMVGPGGMVGADTLASLTGLPGGAAGLPTQTSGEAMRDRERELGALGAMGFIGTGSQRHRDREADRDKELIISGSSRLRFGASDSEAENDSVQQLRAQNQVAFDAFHGISPHQNPPYNGRSILQSSDSAVSRSPSKDSTGFTVQMNGNGNQNGPWSTFTGSSRTSSSRNSSPETDVVNFSSSFSGLTLSNSPVPEQQSRREAMYSPSSEQLNNINGKHSYPVSSASSTSGAKDADDEMETTRFQSPNVASESAAETPPEIASPPVRLNSSDQNPPINTLYVGNLPTSPPPGLPSTHLEESLRALFQPCSGFRRLCFRLKENGPMCFVEFEDVTSASKALGELYGNQLNGLVKTGIRLSYSKNPLGVRSGGSQTRVNGYQHSNSWTTGSPFSSTLSDSEAKFNSPNSFSPISESTNQRASEVSNGVQRSVLLTDPANCPPEGTHSPGTQYSFGNQSSRYFSPPPLYLTTSKFHKSPSIFSPFQSTDVILTPIAREQGIHNVTPSPNMESTRAG